MFYAATTCLLCLSTGLCCAPQICAPSPTVNTREAMQVVNGMFGGMFGTDALDMHKELGWLDKPDFNDTEFENQFAATQGWFQLSL